MDRRRAALGLLLLFVVCLGAAVVVSGSRPGTEQGLAPTVAAFAGYLSAFAAAVLLIVPATGHPDGTRAGGRRILGALLVLVLLDLVTGNVATIGAGLVQLAGELVILVETVRLALGVARARRIG